MRKTFYSLTKSIILLTTLVMAASFSVSLVSAQGTTVKAQPSNATPNVGATISIDITITNVQNLYGVTIQLNWNPTVLKIVSATNFLGVEAHSGGVLHQKVSIIADTSSQQTGEYDLSAFSEVPAASFSGNGKIATLTFIVIHSGHSGLTLQSDLADKPPAGGTSNLINHTDLSGSIDSPVPEFPTAAALVVFLVLAAASLMLAKRHIKKNSTMTSLSAERL